MNHADEFWTQVHAALDARRDPREEPAVQDLAAADPVLAEELEILCRRLDALTIAPRRSDRFLPAEIGSFPGSTDRGGVASPESPRSAVAPAGGRERGRMLARSLGAAAVLVLGSVGLWLALRGGAVPAPGRGAAPTPVSIADAAAEARPDRAAERTEVLRIEIRHTCDAGSTRIVSECVDGVIRRATERAAPRVSLREPDGAFAAFVTQVRSPESR